MEEQMKLVWLRGSSIETLEDLVDEVGVDAIIHVLYFQENEHLVSAQLTDEAASRLERFGCVTYAMTAGEPLSAPVFSYRVWVASTRYSKPISLFRILALSSFGNIRFVDAARTKVLSIDTTEELARHMALLGCPVDTMDNVPTR